MRASIAEIGLVLFAASCRPSTPGADGFTVMDSAGVRIAESSSPQWREGEGWTLSEEPLVQVGVVQGDERYQFNRVWAGALTPDGGFAVLDGSSTLRRFSPDGTFVWTAGRQGDGPGEFSSAVSVRLLGPDSLLVFDRSSARISVFSMDGAFVRSAELEPPPGAMYGMRDAYPAPDGSVVVTSGASSGLLTEPIQQGQVQREEDPVIRFGPEGGAPLNTIGVFAGMEWYRGDRGIGPPPFQHQACFALRDTSLVVGTSDDMSLQLLSLDGDLREIIRVPGVDLAVTDADMKAFVDARLARMPPDENARKQAMDWFDGLPKPEKKAAYSRVMVDEDGDLWVAEAPVRTLAPARWTVFSPDGRLLGDVAVPSDRLFRVLDVGSTKLLGLWMDSLDVENVGVYAIEK